MSSILRKELRFIYRAGGPPALSSDNPTYLQWTTWWATMVAADGIDVLKRPHSGDLVLVLAFFAQWALQVTEGPCDLALVAQVKQAFDLLVNYLETPISHAHGTKRKGSERVKV
jgi:hypothetical protein